VLRENMKKSKTNKDGEDDESLHYFPTEGLIGSLFYSLMSLFVSQAYLSIAHRTFFADEPAPDQITMKQACRWAHLTLQLLKFFLKAL